MDDGSRAKGNLRPLDSRSGKSAISSMLWNIAGTLSLCFGVIGIAVPLIPTTPFLLIAAACYAKGSPRMYKWMMTNRYFGSYLRDYREGRGIPLRVKIGSILFLWAVIGLSATFATQNIYIRVGLIAIAFVVSAHILSIRPKTSVENQP